MKVAAALLYPDALATSVTLPMEILLAAGQMATVRSRISLPRLLLAGPSSDAVTLFGGTTVLPDLTYQQLPPLDLLILPAIWRNPDATINGTHMQIEQLQALAAGGTRICAVGTATCLLAEAGLLDGRPATTHWNYFDQFSKRYPQVKLKTKHLITQSDNIYCVGSVNSIADLMVHFIEDWYGASIARAVENQFSPEIRRSFQGASYQSQNLNSHDDEQILQAQQWLREKLGAKISMGALAAHLQLSPRTLNRRFRNATGKTPSAYLQALRLAQSKDLLRHSNLRVSEIAWQVGLHDVSHFSRLFREQAGITPLQYRAAVRGKLFTG